MNTERKYEPDPVQKEHLSAFLKQITANGKGMPRHVVVGHNGMPLYAQTIPFMLITGGTILSDPYHERELRIVAFEEISDEALGVESAENGSSRLPAFEARETPKVPIIVRVVIHGSDEEKWFLADFK